MSKQHLDPFHKICDLSQLMVRRQQWREAGEQVVFTNGVFDLLHPGHVIYLAEARALGTRLILALNSDASARRLNKGPGRPINDQHARAIVVSALASVDAVVFFDEDTPEQCIAALLPDVLVKGGDYAIENIAGAKIVMDHGGQVKSLNFVDGYSTTTIEKRIVDAHQNAS